MRTTITIPDEYYEKIEGKFKSEGFTTVNDFVLDLIRHHFGADHTTVVTEIKEVPGPIFKESQKSPKPVVTLSDPRGLANPRKKSYVEEVALGMEKTFVRPRGEMNGDDYV